MNSYCGSSHHLTAGNVHADSHFTLRLRTRGFSVDVSGPSWVTRRTTKTRNLRGIRLPSAGSLEPTTSGAVVIHSGGRVHHS